MPCILAGLFSGRIMATCVLAAADSDYIMQLIRSMCSSIAKQHCHFFDLGVWCHDGSIESMLPSFRRQLLVFDNMHVPTDAI